MNNNEKKDLINRVEKFNEVFEKAKNRVINHVLKHAEKHPNNPWSGKQLVVLEQILTAQYQRMNVDIKKAFKQQLPPYIQSFYNKAQQAMNKEVTNVLGKATGQKINFFMKNSFAQVAGMTDRMKQLHVRKLRQISREVFTQTSLTGHSRRNISKQLMNDALKIPDFQFIDRSGRKWAHNTYFNMLTRTELASASRYGTQLKCEEDGYDVVKLSVSGHSCKYCAAYENRLFSLSGVTPNLPTYDDLKANKVFHPNCTHSFTPVSDFMRANKFNDDGRPKKGWNSAESVKDQKINNDKTAENKEIAKQKKKKDPRQLEFKFTKK